MLNWRDAPYNLREHFPHPFPMQFAAWDFSAHVISIIHSAMKFFAWTFQRSHGIILLLQNAISMRQILSFTVSSKDNITYTAWFPLLRQDSRLVPKLTGLTTFFRTSFRSLWGESTLTRFRARTLISYFIRILVATVRRCTDLSRVVFL